MALPISHTTYAVTRGLTSSESSGTVTIVAGSLRDRANALSGYITAAKPSATTAPDTDTGTVLTYTTNVAHGLSVGDLVQINGVSPVDYCGTFTVKSVPSSTQFAVVGAKNATIGNATIGVSSASLATSSTVVNSTGSSVTFTTASAHTFVVGQAVNIASFTGVNTVYNLTNAVITAVTSTTFTVAASLPATSTAVNQSGPATAVLSPTFNGKDVFIAPSTATVAVGTVTNNGTNTDTTTTVLAANNPSGKEVKYITASLAPAAGKKRIDAVVLDVSTNAPVYAVVKGTEVDASANASVPVLTATQIALSYSSLYNVSTSGQTTTSRDPIVDVRGVSTFAPVRAFNRSQNVRINGQKIPVTSEVYIDLDDQGSRKEFAYHSAIGSVYGAGPITQTDSRTVVVTSASPGTISYSNTTISAASAITGELLNRDLDAYVTLSGNAASITCTALSSTTSVNAIIYADFTTGATAGVAGTPANAGTQLDPVLPPNKVALYRIVVTGNGAGSGNTAVYDIRPRAQF